MRRRVSSVGFVGLASKVLTRDWLRPACWASRFIESPRRLRSSLKIRATSTLIALPADSFNTDHRYAKINLTVNIIKLISNAVMFIRRLGPTTDAARCAGGHACPDVLEMDGGDFAIIGADITHEALGKLPPGSGCSPSERIVRVPRRTLVLARADIPAE